MGFPLIKKKKNISLFFLINTLSIQFHVLTTGNLLIYTDLLCDTDIVLTAEIDSDKDESLDEIHF